MADRIQQRRDTSERWAFLNPTLLEGEMAFVLDNPNYYKIGDGINAWNNLPLRGFSGNIAESLGNDSASVVSQKVVSKEFASVRSDLNELNVTVKYRLSSGYYNITAAINAIPINDRRPGMSIVFEEAERKWAEYQFMLSDETYIQNVYFLIEEYWSRKISKEAGNSDTNSISQKKYSDTIIETPINQFDTGCNTVDFSNAEIGYLAENGKGKVNSGYIGWHTTLTRKVISGEIVISNVKCYVTYDKYLKMVNRVEYSSDNSIKKISISDSEKYIRMSYYDDNLSKCYAITFPSFLSYHSLINQPNLFNSVKNILDIDKDVYISLLGDSVAGSNNAYIVPKETQSKVPPVCDRINFPYNLWKKFQYGNVNYRRFDDGRLSLLDGWNQDESIIDDSNAFFTESGIWNTYYKEGGLTDNSYITLNSGIYRGNYTTKPAIGSNPSLDIGYCSRLNSIPQRVSMRQNDYVEFTIPSGYKKFDVLINMCLNGDTITITTSGGNCMVSYNKRGLDEIIANNATFNTAYTSNDGSDVGMSCKRLYFTKDNRDTAVTVRLTKTTEGKVLNYWGVSYWSTIFSPNALQFNNCAISGGSIEQLYAIRKTIIDDHSCDFAVIENTTLNSLHGSPTNDKSVITDSYIANRALLTSYLALKEIDFIDFISHQRSDWVSDTNSSVFNNCLIKIKREISNCIDINDAFFRVYANKFSAMEYSDFINMMTIGDGVHPNDDGFLIWDAAIDSSF